MIIVAARNIFCLIGLLIIMPVIFLSAMFLLAEDGLPIFFKQRRLGLNKKIFTIYKLRTLKKDAPQVGTHELEDSYKLKSGKLIRALKLDEFPQLFNVIKGDINLIGPRPGLDTQIELEEARFLSGVHSIKPGISGLAQILGYDMSNPSALAKIDKIYIQNKSLKLDFIILIGTFIKFPRNYLAATFKISNLKNR